MRIEIDQTLHGYDDGHQLLGSSMRIASDVGKILLFQSDLSGSYNNQSFDSYITGYPIKNANIYILSKTWYAYEMKRPGCVWTHSLIIKFSDLGKIPELSDLYRLFERPTSSNFLKYELPINYDYKWKFFDGNKDNGFDHKTELLYSAVYSHPNQAIILPSSDSKNDEFRILDLWSNQWPRLRRNFFFCTGALSLKSLGNRLFDIQVIPLENSKGISRNTSDLFLVTDMHFPSSWVRIVDQSGKEDLKKFLWTYGSDIEGGRSSYQPLIELYNAIYIDHELEYIDVIIKENFSNPQEAKRLKMSLYASDSILNNYISEKELILFLIERDNLNYLSGIELELPSRIMRLFENGIIEQQELFKYWQLVSGYIKDVEFKNLTIAYSTEILNIIDSNPSVISMLLETHPLIFLNEASWKINFEYQKNILYGFSIPFIEKNIDELIYSILRAQSNIIFDLYHRMGKNIVQKSLDWSNGNPGLLKKEWLEYIVNDLQTIFIMWIKENEKSLSLDYFVLIFNRLNAKIITTLNFKHTTWIEHYKHLMDSPKVNRSFIATTILTIGFKNDIKNSEWLTAISFCDVYSFAAAHSLDNNLWNLLPKEYGDDNDQQDFNFLEEILKMLKIRPKKRHQIESWDYCEYLIRTICGKTIMYNWNPGAFLRALESPPIFYRAIDYCFTFKKGYNFALKIWLHIIGDKCQYLSFQKDYLKKIFK